MYIGIECASAWCIIGVRQPGVNPLGAGHPMNGRSDRQRLAYYNDKDELRVSKLWGQITAKIWLTVPDYEADFVEVATITFTGSDEAAERHLRRKFSLPDDSLPKTVTIFLKHPAGAPADIWLIRYNQNGGWKLAKVDTLQNHPRGGARWRWSEKDEGFWVYCPSGCCGDDYP